MFDVTNHSVSPCINFKPLSSVPTCLFKC